MLNWSSNDERFMKMAMQEAQNAFDQDEIPVGAILVVRDQVIAKAHNQTQLLNDVTAHAEILAITSGFQHLGSKYLTDCTLYITLEPCLMCAGALHWSKISRIVWGADDDKNGHRRYCTHSPFHIKTQIDQGLFADECARFMKDFFKQKRNTL